MMAMFKLKPGTTGAQLKKALLSSDQNALEQIAAPGGDPTVFGMPAPLSPKASTTTVTSLQPAPTGWPASSRPDGRGGAAAQGMYRCSRLGKSAQLRPRRW